MSYAASIARMIISTSTELRGNLFMAVAESLRKHGQNYTASLFEKIANEYGIRANHNE